MTPKNSLQKASDGMDEGNLPDRHNGRPEDRTPLLAGTLAALAAALAAALLPLWPVMECGTWECRFPQGNLPASIASFLLPQNQPEAAHAFSSGLLPSLLGLLAVIMLAFALGYALARRFARP